MNLYANMIITFNLVHLLEVFALEEKQRDYSKTSLQQDYALAISSTS